MCSELHRGMTMIKRGTSHCRALCAGVWWFGTIEGGANGFRGVRSPPRIAVEHFTLPAQKPTRIDTLRDFTARTSPAATAHFGRHSRGQHRRGGEVNRQLFLWDLFLFDTSGRETHVSAWRV